MASSNSLRCNIARTTRIVLHVRLNELVDAINQVATLVMGSAGQNIIRNATLQVGVPVQHPTQQ